MVDLLRISDLAVLSRNRQATGDGVSIRVEDGEMIAGKLLILHKR
jgi:hypothetical protein